MTQETLASLVEDGRLPVAARRELVEEVKEAPKDVRKGHKMEEQPKDLLVPGKAGAHHLFGVVLFADAGQP